MTVVREAVLRPINSAPRCARCSRPFQGRREHRQGKLRALKKVPQWKEEPASRWRVLNLHIVLEESGLWDEYWQLAIRAKATANDRGSSLQSIGCCNREVDDSAVQMQRKTYFGTQGTNCCQHYGNCCTRIIRQGWLLRS
jgi:hypothetical protein